MALAKAEKCGYPVCSCVATSGMCCSVECESMATKPGIDCLCAHTECKDNRQSADSSPVEIPSSIQRRRNLKKLRLSEWIILRPEGGHTLFAPGWRLTVATLLMATGNGVWGAEPQVNLSANQLTFPAQIQGTVSASQLVILTNSGEADLSISGITISGQSNADFAQTNNCPVSPGMLAARTRCEIRVMFSPTVTGTLSAALSVADNASGSPQTVNLKGVSTAPGPVASLVPASLAFGNQTQGTSSAVRVIVLTNGGSGTLNINSEISINGPTSDEFHLQAVKNSCPSGSWQLPPKTSCEIGVVFAPVTIGVKSAQILIMDDAAGSPHSIELSGAGIPPQVISKNNP